MSRSPVELLPDRTGVVGDSLAHVASATTYSLWNAPVSESRAWLLLMLLAMALAITLQDTRDVVELTALLAAAAFFLGKWIGGWFSPSMVLSLVANRVAGTADTDDILCLQVALVRTSSGNVTFDDFRARAVWEGAHGGRLELVNTLLDAVARAPVTKAKSADRRWTLTGGWPTPVLSSRAAIGATLNLPSSDGTCFGTWFLVPRSAICSVDVVVVTARRLRVGRWVISSRPGQWRASIASPPRAA